MARSARKCSRCRRSLNRQRRPSWPRFEEDRVYGCTPGADATLDRYLGASILILSSGSILPSSAADPAGYASLLKRKLMMSAACSGVSDPGAVAGIVVDVFSKRSPTVLPCQFARKSLPASGGIG